MDTVDPSKVIVSYRGIAQRLSRGREAVATPGAGPLQGASEMEKAAFVAGLEQAEIEIQSVTNPKAPSVLAVPDHGPAALLLSYLAQDAVQNKKIIPAPSGYEVKFDDHDLAGWIGSFFTWWRGLSKATFLTNMPLPEPAPNDLRVAVLGDWGTNLYGAPVAARTIQESRPAYNLVLHLGDVYYSGMEDECQTRMLGPWPKIPGAVSRALNANHEMYTGGHGYFGKILPAFQQRASYFAMANDHFVLVFLDTAYEDHDLAGDQATWIQALLADAGDRKVVLFSHHQPFSTFEVQGPKLLAKLDPLIRAGRIFAWYWGHEHRCALYERGKYGFWGRCIGHSGYPYFRKDLTKYPLYREPVGDNRWYSTGATDHAPEAHFLDGPNPYVDAADSPASYGPQGYVTLQFLGPELYEYVHLPDGTVVYEQTLR